MPIIANTQQFLTDVLSSPDFHIPVEANFVVGFDNISSILSNLQARIVPDSILTKPAIWDDIKPDDVYFANSVTIPGETVTTTKAGYSSTNNGLYGGLLSGPVLTGRSNLTNFEITFLETNQSFADQVIRPWVVNAAHFGLFARANDLDSQKQNFKTNVTVMFLDKTGADPKSPKPRKTILFKNAVPVSVEQSAASYGGSRVASRNVKTTWTYSTYEIS